MAHVLAVSNSKAAGSRSAGKVYVAASSVLSGAPSSRGDNQKAFCRARRALVFSWLEPIIRAGREFHSGDSAVWRDGANRRADVQQPDAPAGAGHRVGVRVLGERCGVVERAGFAGAAGLAHLIHRIRPAILATR
jgi:hypothetical protein